MKSLQIAALLVLCVGFAEALRCKCVYKQGQRTSYTFSQNCRGDDNVCVVLRSYEFQYHGCMKTSYASALRNSGWRVSMCDTNLCNK